MVVKHFNNYIQFYFINLNCSYNHFKLIFILELSHCNSLNIYQNLLRLQNYEIYFTNIKYSVFKQKIIKEFSQLLNLFAKQIKLHSSTIIYFLENCFVIKRNGKFN